MEPAIVAGPRESLQKHRCSDGPCASLEVWLKHWHGRCYCPRRPRKGYIAKAKAPGNPLPLFAWLCQAQVTVCGCVSPESFEMGLKMSDAIDTNMVEDALVVIDRACKQFKRNVFVRATQELDWLARHRADDVLVCFDEVRYAGHRRNKDLLLVELEQLCHNLQRTMVWSQVSRPFDTGAYQLTLDSVAMAQCAIHSALGLYKPCPQLSPQRTSHVQSR